MAATTFRVDLRAALVAILTDQQTATPTLLRKVHPNRPGSFGERPCAYVSGMPERLTHDAGTRTRFIGAQVMLVDSYRDNQQSGDLLDQLVDLLVDRFDLPGNVQKVPGGGSIIELTSITDTDIEMVHPETGVSTIYRGVLLDFSGDKTFVSEGRQ